MKYIYKPYYKEWLNMQNTYVHYVSSLLYLYVHIKVKIYAISSDSHQLHYTLLHHFTI